MTHVYFDPDTIDWSAFLAAQQIGGGERQYFVGSKYQRGYGFLGNVVKFLTPIAKNIANAAGNEGIAAGQRVLGDIAQGKDLKDALKEHSKQGLENLATKLQQCGKGKRQLLTKSNLYKGQVIDQLSFV